jgi:hypothetical protein
MGRIISASGGEQEASEGDAKDAEQAGIPGEWHLLATFVIIEQLFE